MGKALTAKIEKVLSRRVMQAAMHLYWESECIL